jgi:hypothetical protein
MENIAVDDPILTTTDGLNQGRQSLAADFHLGLVNQGRHHRTDHSTGTDREVRRAEQVKNRRNRRLAVPRRRALYRE